MNIAALLHDAVKKFKNKIAVIENGEEISYDELGDKIDRLSAAFHKVGIRKNHRVALILPNSIEFIYCFFALLRINAVVSPLSPDSTPFELSAIFSNLNPHAIITLPLFTDRLRGEYSSLLEDKILIFQDTADTQRKIKNCYTLKNLFGLGDNCRTPNTELDLDPIATILYTYRGIGYPLGAVLTHENYRVGIQTYRETTRVSSQHRVLSLLPLSHIYPLVGCMLAPLISGATIVISRNYMPRSILKVIEDYKINYFTVVPSIYNLLLQHYKGGEYDLSSLTCCITGGAYMPLHIQDAIKIRMGLEVLQGYGLTECFIVAWNRHEYNKRATLGLPFSNDIQFSIIGDDGMHKGVSEVGEIVIKTPAVMQGYYNKEDETHKVLKNGWFYTGDYGYLDGDGYLYFTGLKKSVTKVGGNMVDFKEVQNVLLSHPLISAASVYSEENSLWGHVIAAEVVSQVNGALTENEIKVFCSKRISRYKVPKTIKLMKLTSGVA